MASQVDFGRCSEDYAAFRPGLPDALYDRLERFIHLRGSDALDLATGPGTVALALAARDASVVGVDVSSEQIETAKRLAAERGLADRATFRVARAEDTGMSAASFDLVTAAQCWHWFDVPAVLSEIRRVLRPGGLLAVIHNAYVPEHSALARDTESLILEFNPTWTMAGGSGMFPGEVDEVVRGGLRFVEQFCWDHDVAFSHEAWLGRIRTCNGVGPTLAPEEVRRFEENLRGVLCDGYSDPVAVRHRLWCVLARVDGTPS